MLRAADAEHEDAKAPGLAGESAMEAERTQITVTNAHGHLCHIKAVSHYSCPPQTLMDIFCNPGQHQALALCQPASVHLTYLRCADNTALFRDIKAVTSRSIKHEDTAKGLKIIQAGQQMSCTQAAAHSAVPS